MHHVNNYDMGDVADAESTSNQPGGDNEEADTLEDDPHGEGKLNGVGNGDGVGNVGDDDDEDQVVDEVTTLKDESIL